MTDWRSERVQSAIAGRNPTVLAELEAAYAVIGDVQFLPGYPDRPIAVEWSSYLK
ncbi:hypothetical protein ABT304_28285 [Nocardioides sp. NPDC000445]|uniref:hypothetical protein n=1 Tax=Nocardioides sp. NPDC000445 TaxID=3154257 RepID=UPI00331E249F